MANRCNKINDDHKLCSNDNYKILNPNDAFANRSSSPVTSSLFVEIDVHFQLFTLKVLVSVIMYFLRFSFGTEIYFPKYSYV